MEESILEQLCSITTDRQYYLMNKDTVLAKIKVVGEGVLEGIQVIEEYWKKPAWIVDTAKFIENRRAPKNRENIKHLLQLSGCDTIEGYLQITHSLTLVDTFWVKPIDSALIWDDVSLFTNPFNDVIAKTAFEGGLHGYELSTTSPEYGTDGTFAKCWTREDGIIKMLKRGSSGARNTGLEPYSEFYASQIAGCFGKPFVKYGLGKHDNRMHSTCNCFTDENIGFLPFAAVDRGGSTLNSVLRTAAELGFENEVKTMFILDAIIFNEDRHKGNFGFLVNNDSQKIVGFAPYFDHNISLLPYAEEEDFDNIDEYLKMKGPRIGDDFTEIAKALLSSDTRKTLVQLSDFKFEEHEKYNLPQWRLEALENLIHKQILSILN